MSNASDFVIKRRVLKKYVGPGGDVVIPDGVKRIDCSAFANCSTLTSVVIPEGVTSIGTNAFVWCNNLESVSLPSSVVEFGKLVFNSCYSLTVVNVAGGECKISSEIFYDWKDTLRININDISRLSPVLRLNAVLSFAENGGNNDDLRRDSHYKYIKANADKQIDLFTNHVELMTLMCREKLIPAKCANAYLETVQRKGNPELVAMMLDYTGTKLSAKEKDKAEKQKVKQEEDVFARMLVRQDKKGIDGLRFTASGTPYHFIKMDEMKEYIELNGGKLVSSVSAKVDYLVSCSALPSQKNQRAKELGISIIGERDLIELVGQESIIENGILKRYIGFSKDVVIPEGVTSIGNKAFYRSISLTSIVIPGSVTSIGDMLFSSIRTPMDIYIPSSVTCIGSIAFSGCHNLTIHAPAGSYAEQYAKEHNIPFVAE